jgi:hypothetical protein
MDVDVGEEEEEEEDVDYDDSTVLKDLCTGGGGGGLHAFLGKGSKRGDGPLQGFKSSASSSSSGPSLCDPALSAVYSLHLQPGGSLLAAGACVCVEMGVVCVCVCVQCMRW